MIPQVHEKISFTRLYRHTGIQFQPFNTIYQLYADKIAGRLEGVTDFLMISEYLMYRLAAQKATSSIFVVYFSYSSNRLFYCEISYIMIPGE